MIDLQLPPPPTTTATTMNLTEVKALSILGRGSKGVVFLIRAEGETLALKAISRSSVENKRPSAAGSGGEGAAYRRIWFERDVLSALRHPLLPSLRGVVSTDKIVAFAIDRCSGGHLNSLRRTQTESMFSDDIIRFYAAELVIALQYLHGIGIVYRDLKPENVMIQDNGHLMLVDFDLSARLPSDHPAPLKTPRPSAGEPAPPTRRKKRFSFFACSTGVSPESATESREEQPSSSDGGGSGSAAGKSNSFVGTEEYVAPEIIQGNGHDFAVDWWSLGVVLYEMLYGRTPFRGQNRKETFYRILSKDPELVGERSPLRDLIGRLLAKDPAARISGEEIRRHEFFRGVEWESVVEIGRPPFIPLGAEWEEENNNSPGIDVEHTVDDIFETAQPNKASVGLKVEEGLSNPCETGDFSVF